MPISIQNDQFQIVQELLKRQDEALEQIDQLNSMVEQAIAEVNAFRNVEEEATGQLEGEDLGEMPAKIAA